MKLKRLILLFFIATPLGSAAQSETDFLHKRYIIERLTAGQGVLTSGTIPNLPSRPPEIQGDVYLTKEYQFCSFELFNEAKVFSGYWARFDIQANSFDLIQPQGVRSLPGDKVKSAVLYDSITKAAHYFFNGNQFKNTSGTPYVGFFELLSEGDIPLLKMTSIELIKANFNPALNVGSKDHKYVKDLSFYYLKSGKVEKLPKKKLSDIFENNNDAIKKFAASKNLKKQSDLIAIFDYYNSLKLQKDSN